MALGKEKQSFQYKEKKKKPGGVFQVLQFQTDAAAQSFLQCSRMKGD